MTHQVHIFNRVGNPFEGTSIKTPTPTTGQVLVSVLSTPILHYIGDGMKEGGLLANSPQPLVPGLGGIGRVLEVGSPNSTSLQPGNLVFCSPSIRARDDSSGHTSIIQGWFSGVTPASRRLMEEEFRHGSFAEKMIVPVENATVIDELDVVQRLGYGVTQLCWIFNILIGHAGLEASALKAGETVIVAPATGHFGGCAVLATLAMGADRVIALGCSK